MKIVRIISVLFLFMSFILPTVAHATENPVTDQLEVDVDNVIDSENLDDSTQENVEESIEPEQENTEEPKDPEEKETVPDLPKQETVPDLPEQPLEDEKNTVESEVLDADKVKEETIEESEMSEDSQEMSIMSISSAESSTSRLGHINNGSARIYKDYRKLANYVQAGSTNTNQVYYIKKQAKYNNVLYYLISQNSSSVKGVVGWIKSTDMKTYSHVKVDDKPKNLYIKGTGSAYTKAWGGKKNYSYEKLSAIKNQTFVVNLTEKVGDIIWYRGSINGKTAWIEESNVLQKLEQGVESSTSRLGHINNGSVRIYKNYAQPSDYVQAGSKNTNQVYYIKKQAKYNNVLYYLISQNSSSVNGVVGWVKSTDMETHAHVKVDEKPKTLYIKGTGSAYTKAWGGKKNYSYEKLSTMKNQTFVVNLTEKVGNVIWYRGSINGKIAWIQESDIIQQGLESTISRLGHINNGSVRIYKNYAQPSDYVQAGSKNTNQVYYIKKQAKYNNVLYYLISQNSSSVNGVVGWVKSTDMKTFEHVRVDGNAKTLYIKGPGSAYTKAWGGSKNLQIANLNSFKGQQFKVNLTEKVGNDVWYRGILNGKTAWIHSSYISTTPLKVVDKTYTNYNLTFSKMTDIQSIVAPQTDKKYPLWIREDAFEKGSLSNNQGTIVKGANWNLRRAPSTKSSTGGQVAGGTKLTIYASAKGTDDAKYTWYHVRNTSGWVQPDRVDLSYYLNPSNFTSFKDSLQFLKLSHSANIDVAEVNAKVLKGKGILAERAQAFVDAGKTHGVNEIYLISHALLETGNGSSTLAKGVKYNGKTVYNMYGIGAKDSCPLECGTKYAYDAGWFTPELAIVGGASFIGKGYVQAGQDTLYKMRWNPSFAERNGYASHQYATDIGWASKQTSKMNELYGLLDSYRITLDIPRYK